MGRNDFIEKILGGVFALISIIGAIVEMVLNDFSAASIAGGVKDVFATLVVVILLSFILIDMSPINPVNAYISNMVVSPEKVAQLEAYWGVNQPITEKMLNWLGNILTGDFGTSLIYRTPVLHVISEKFKKENRFSASSESGNYFNSTVTL